MATSIKPGGAYLSADGKTWHDANGKPIEVPTAPVIQVREIEHSTPPAPVEAAVVEAKPAPVEAAVVEAKPAAEAKPVEAKLKKADKQP